jgi:hypothetical protein
MTGIATGIIWIDPNALLSAACTSSGRKAGEGLQEFSTTKSNDSRPGTI